MSTLFELAAARRAEIDAEIRQIDKFLEKAEYLLARRLREAMRVQPATVPAENVIPFPERSSNGWRGATTDETGA